MGNVVKLKDRKSLPTQSMLDNALEYYEANKEANAAKAKADKARKALYAEMKQQGIDAFFFDVKTGSSNVPMQAFLNTPMSDVPNVNQLKKELKPDVFMAVISATKKSVEAIGGKALLAKVCVSTPGEENVYVKKED